jgi:hypothetical protein
MTTVRWRRWMLVAVWTVGVVSPLPTLLAGVPTWGWGFPASFAVTSVIVATLGAVIDRAEPGHVVGRLFMVGALLGVSYQLCVDLLLVIDVPGRNQLWAIFEHALWMPPLAIWFTGLGLFPDGRWAFRGAKAIVIGGCWLTAAAMIPIGATLPPLDPTFSPNPGAWGGWTDLPADLPLLPVALLQMSPLALAVGHGIRFRRADSPHQRQIGVVIAAIALLGMIAIVSFLFADDFGTNAIATAEMVSLVGIFVAIAVAIARYRLYELDRLVSRTVTYLVVVAVLGVTYVGLVVTLRSLFPVEGELPVAMSTLAVAVAFLPLARRVQHVVDRRFFRSRYDAAHVVARVAEELRGTLDLDDVTARAEAVVSEVFSPDRVGVWLSNEAS